MDPAAAKTLAHVDLSWKTLGAYARAIQALTSAPAADLKHASFEKVSAIDWADLPPAKAFDVPGGRLGYRHYPAATSDRALVLVHGSACFGDLAHPMAQQVAGQDVAHVYTLDMRGHGLSEGPRGHSVRDPAELVDDIARFLGRLHAERPRAQITLAGHSAGGGVVLAFARSASQHLASSYIFLAPYLGLGSPLNRPHFGGWVRLRGLTLKALTLANLLGITRFNEATVVDFNVEAAGDPRYVASWSFNTLLAFGPGRWLADAPPLPRRKPVLVIAGQDDECFVQPLYRSAFDQVAPHAEVVDIGRGGHWDLLVSPRTVAAVIGWLSRHDDSRARRIEQPIHRKAA